MKYSKEILALLVLILLVVGYFYLNNNTVEGLNDKQNLSEIQKQFYATRVVSMQYLIATGLVLEMIIPYGKKMKLT